MSDDLKNDLKMASSSSVAPGASAGLRISPDELTPDSKPTVGLKLKKAQGPKAIASSHPTLKASAKPVEVAQVAADVPQVQVMATAPSPSETPAPAAPPMARPAPMPMPTGSGPSAGTETGTSAGSILGGIFGAVIRGGTVDDDHCDPRGRGGPGRRPATGTIPGVPGVGVYVPNPRGGTIVRPIIGGMGAGRNFPILPMARHR
jgi:hypothetical protein